MKRIITVAGLFLLAFSAGAQQDVQYTQYMFNQLSLNPGYAGSKDALNTALTYRDQWRQMEGAPKSVMAFVHAPLKIKKIGLGAQLSSDEIGPKKVLGLSGTFAYRLYLGNNGKLAMGLRYGMYNYTFDWTMINYKDPTDPYNTQNITHKLVPTADFGIYFNSLNYYAGLSATHIFGDRTITEGVDNPIGANAELKPHVFTTGGAAFSLMDNLVFNPSLLIKFVESAPPSADLSLNFLIDEKIWLGTSYRMEYGLTFLAQYNITPKFKIGYSYDAGFNKIGRVSGASHEVMIGYDFNIFKSQIISPRYL